MSSGRSIWSGLKIPLFLITGTGIALRLIPVVLPSVNFIGVVDIYYADTEACKALLSFHNPYTLSSILLRAKEMSTPICQWYRYSCLPSNLSLEMSATAPSSQTPLQHSQ